jgi:hypothetical protein
MRRWGRLGPKILAKLAEHKVMLLALLVASEPLVLAAPFDGAARPAVAQKHLKSPTTGRGIKRAVLDHHINQPPRPFQGIARGLHWSPADRKPAPSHPEICRFDNPPFLGIRLDMMKPARAFEKRALKTKQHALNMDPIAISLRMGHTAIQRSPERTHKQAGHRLATEAPEGKNRVVFTAGGNAAGKSTALAVSGVATREQVVFDSTFSNPEHAKRLIEQLLGAGRTVTVLYVTRPLGEIFPAMQDRAQQEGRVVTIDQLIGSHGGATGSPRVVARV